MENFCSTSKTKLCLIISPNFFGFYFIYFTIYICIIYLGIHTFLACSRLKNNVINGYSGPVLIRLGWKLVRKILKQNDHDLKKKLPTQLLKINFYIFKKNLSNSIMVFFISLCARTITILYEQCIIEKTKLSLLVID